jgi:tripartite-type tricarboxylate transporter receptor subunit TctC
MRVRIALAAAFFSVTAAPASAQDDVAAFYKGKQVRLIVGSAVGGGYDLYSRALARHMVNHIPGNPTIIVQNQPAAGGMILTNQLYNQGPKDGTAFSAPLNSMPTAPMLMNGAQFDATKLNWLGSLNREAYVAFLWHTAPVSHIADMAPRKCSSARPRWARP